MQQLLINRFRGLFLSVAVLEAHVQGSAGHPGKIAAIPSKEYGWEILPENLGWCGAIATSTQTLISTQALCPGTACQTDDACARLLAGLLPAALFWHDDVSCLENQLGQCLSGTDSELQAGGVGMGVAIARLCREQANPQTLISHLLAQPCLSETYLHAQLSQIQGLLDAHASLTRVWYQIGQDQTLPAHRYATAIAMAVYTWATSADSWPLTIARILALPQPSVIAALMASALSGVFNGINGIPLNWQTSLSAASSLGSREHSLALADQLLTTWSGYYGHQALPPAELEITTVSAPGVLRFRE
ncbi:hypothetical protein [Acaryochloris sp. IP29b_bin.148]|uniref:hypothetical protein n=1 Tax=Acaryochloris sp. IP29b_bin.148 TaxID=2969218 RepID=UPI0026374B3C|nr:hypothetical protein [Acaryochloris sp. IP29b_bin.148]